MKYILYVLGALIALVALVLAAGLALPKGHVARVRAHYRQPPQALFEAIVNIGDGPEWRTGLDSVVLLSKPADPLMWREHASWGTITFVHHEIAPFSRVVTRIADESEGFGGNWTYELAPDATGTVLTITENGTVNNPLFRFMSKFVFGQYKSLETYAQDLGRKFNENIVVERAKD